MTKPPPVPTNADRFEGLFVDLYGTLAGGDHAAINALCAHLVTAIGLALRPPELAVAWGERFFKAIDASETAEFRPLWQIEHDTLVATLADLDVTYDACGEQIDQLAAFARSAPLHAEVNGFLASCPLPVYLVSNADETEVNAWLARHRLPITGYLTSERARSYKPHRAIFDRALAETGWDRGRVAHIGDSLHSDIAGAQAAGLHAIWLNRQDRVHDVGASVADVTCHDLTEVLLWLRQPAESAA